MEKVFTLMYCYDCFGAQVSLEGIFKTAEAAEKHVATTAIRLVDYSSDNSLDDYLDEGSFFFITETETEVKE